MEIKNIYIGTWFQRTSLHLKEFFYFLETGKSKLELDPEQLARLYKNLIPDKFCWSEEEIFDCLRADFKGIIMEFFEDGLVLLEKRFQKFPEDLGVLKEFYEQKLSPAIAYLYSLGAPLPKELAKMELILPYIIVASGTKKEEVEKLFSNFQEIILSSVEKPEISIYSGKKLVLINRGDTPHPEDLQTKEIAKYLIFFREFETQLNGYLQAHRVIWEEIEKIRSKPNLRFKDFPEIRNYLMGIKQTLSFVAARLAQMGNFITVRQVSAKEKNLEDILKAVSLYQFDTLSNSQKYISDLWKMTQDYADSTVNLLSMFYQENVQRAIDALKLVTIISVVMALLKFPGLAISELSNFLYIRGLIIIFVLAAIFYFGMQYWFISRKFDLRKKIEK